MRRSKEKRLKWKRLEGKQTSTHMYLGELSIENNEATP